MGRIVPSGYGHFRPDRRNDVRAHRYALMVQTGVRNTDLLACHTCDVKGCCNPGHLYWGTKSQNGYDRYQRGGKGGQKLIPSQVDYIKLLLAGGLSHRQIAACYCVSICAVQAINVGRTWR